MTGVPLAGVPPDCSTDRPVCNDACCEAQQARSAIAERPGAAACGIFRV